MAIPLPAPGENLIVWSAQYGRPAIELLNALSIFQVDLVAPGGNVRFPNRLIGLDSGRPIMQIPVLQQMPVNIPNAAVTTASNTATINALLAALRTGGYIKPL